MHQIKTPKSNCNTKHSFEAHLSFRQSLTPPPPTPTPHPPSPPPLIKLAPYTMLFDQHPTQSQLPRSKCCVAAIACGSLAPGYLLTSRSCIISILAGRVNCSLTTAPKTPAGVISLLFLGGGQTAEYKAIETTRVKEIKSRRTPLNTQH